MKKGVFLREILSDIRKGKLSPFYLFYGENEYLKDLAVETIRRELIPDEVKELNFKVFYSDEMASDISSLMEFVRSFPFMSDKKLAVVRDIDMLRDSLLNGLVEYLKDPVEFSCIIFHAQKPDFRIKFFKYIRDSERALQFKQLNEYEAISWIEQRVKDMGMEIRREACAHLYYMIGNNLYELSNEIQKLFSYYGEGSIIGVDEVKFVASPLRDYSIFDLMDSISSKSLGSSLRILNNYLEREGKDKALQILGMLIRQLTLIQKTKNIIQKGGDIKKVQKELQLYTFLAKKLITQTQYWTEKDIEDAFSKLSEVDGYIKTGLSGPLVLEQLIISLCS